MSVPVQTAGTGAGAQRVPLHLAQPRPRGETEPAAAAPASAGNAAGSGGGRLSPGLLPTASDGLPGSPLPRLPPRHAAKLLPLWHQAPARGTAEGRRRPVPAVGVGCCWGGGCQAGTRKNRPCRGAGAGGRGQECSAHAGEGGPRQDKTRLLSSGDGCCRSLAGPIPRRGLLLAGRPSPGHRVGCGGMQGKGRWGGAGARPGPGW